MPATAQQAIEPHELRDARAEPQRAFAMPAAATNRFPLIRRHFGALHDRNSAQVFDEVRLSSADWKPIARFAAGPPRHRA